MKKSVKKVAIIAVVSLGAMLGTAGKAEARQIAVGTCIGGLADAWSYHSFLGIHWGTQYIGQVPC